MWPPAAPHGRALVADLAVASDAVPQAPAPFVWPNLRNASPDVQYNATTGEFLFLRDLWFWSVASWHVVGSTARFFYADAEFSTDGGDTWTRGTNSLRIEQAATSGRTLSFPFAGWFPHGLRLRFVIWASGSGVTITTDAVSGSTSPASRLTTVTIPGSQLP
jgi:hypothetical protein